MSQHLLYHERPRGEEIWAWIINVLVIFGGPCLIWYIGNAFLTRYKSDTFGMLMTSIIMLAAFVFYVWFCWELFFGSKKKGEEKRGFFKSKPNERFIVINGWTESARVAPTRWSASIPLIDQVDKKPIDMDIFTVVVKDVVPFDDNPPIQAEAQIILRIGPSEEQILRSRNLGTDRKLLVEKLQREGSQVLNIAIRIAESSYGRENLLSVQQKTSALFGVIIRNFETMQIHGLLVENASINELNDVEKVADLKLAKKEVRETAATAAEVTTLIKDKGINPDLIDLLGTMISPKGDLSKRITDIEGSTTVADRIAAKRMTMAGLLGHPERDL